ncbi:MAG: patatin-like phospholipase family protein [Aestuariibaculum sp.]
MKKPFQKALVFSGGGTRFALYGGIYQALDQSGLKPDILIASCGGALSATLINAFSTHEQRLAYLCSDVFYHFIKQTTLTPYRKLSKIGCLAFKKKYNQKRAPVVEDVFSRYLIDMPQDLSLYLPQLDIDFSQNIPTVIVGAKMLFFPEECSQNRKDRKLYQKILLTDTETAKHINLGNIKITSDNYKNSAVHDDTLLRTDISMLDAVRISISDMFYMAPFFNGKHYFSGGAVDLVPVELATVLSKTIFAEKKQFYSTTEEAFVLAVLGFSGNKRLEEVSKFKIDTWIDTQDASVALNGHYCQKFINWKKMEVGIKFSKTQEQFKDDIQKQWDYGYKKTLKSIGL